MNSPKMREEAAGAPTQSRPNCKPFASTFHSTKQAEQPDLAASYIADRYGLPMPLAMLAARLAEIAGALS
jgi:hypothetical protein